MHAVSRRQFLGTSLVVLSGARALTTRATEAATREEPAAKEEPTKREPTKQEPVRFPVTVRDQHLRETGQTTCWAALQVIGVDGVEVVAAEDLSLPALVGPEGPYTLASAAGIAKLVADARAAKMRITAVCLSNRFDERPDAEVEWVVKAARAAKALEAPALRIDVVPSKLSGDDFVRFSIDMMRKLLAATEDTGLPLGIENHGNTTNDPDFLKKLFGAVDSKRLGLTLDTANFYWFGHPLSQLYEIYEAFAPRVHHTHVKSIKYPEASRERRRAVGWEYAKYNCPVYEGDIDFRRVVTILRKAGYRNDLCIEDESLGKFRADERKGVLAREARFLREIQ